MYFATRLRAHESITLDLNIACQLHKPTPSRQTYDRAYVAAERVLQRAKQNGCTLSTSNEQFNGLAEPGAIPICG